jgi:antitoxin component of RelBE/YafQ-DinJ toxin-antitoxin module
MSITLNFKTDKDLKDKAKKMASDLGLPLGTIMNHYLKEFVREKKVIFTNHPTPTKKVVYELKKISKDIRDRKNLSPTFNNKRDAIKWLNS